MAALTLLFHFSAQHSVRKRFAAALSEFGAGMVAMASHAIFIRKILVKCRFSPFLWYSSALGGPQANIRQRMAVSAPSA
jgi:hypothetical protein